MRWNDFNRRWHTALSFLLTLIVSVSIATFAFELPHPVQQKPVESVKTDTSQKAPLFFAAFGDMGSRLPGQYATAEALIKSYQRKPFQFVLMLGDNVYPDGDVKKYGDASFTKPYGPLLNQHVRFYAALGNHDVNSGHQAESMAFYHMPAAYYTFHQGPVDFFVLNTNAFDITQQHWLDKALDDSTAPWKIVYGHHPVFSSGLHGPDLSLDKLLQPVLAKHHVQLYLAGHEHDYERFAPVDGVTHVISGGGGASLRPFRSPVAKGSLVRQSVYHFLRLQATDTRLKVTALNDDLQPIDQFTLSP